MKTMPIESVKRASFTELAYIEIKRRILDNEMPAGSTSLEQEIAAQLEMSRTPVRESLQRLQNEGLIEIIPRRGIRVLPLSSNDMAEIYAILTALESAAAEQVAATGLENHDLEALNKPVVQMEEALQKDDLTSWAVADEKFHKLLVQLCGNQRLISAVDMYWDQSHRARMVTLKLRPKPLQSNRDHRDVVEAIVRRDPEMARQIHQQHRSKSGAMLVQLLEELGLQQL